jgi:hypothetical protein
MGMSEVLDLGMLGVPWKSKWGPIYGSKGPYGHWTFLQKPVRNLLSGGALDRSGAPPDREQGWILWDLD